MKLISIFLTFISSLWAQSYEKEHRQSFFTPIERFGSHYGFSLRISEADFLVRTSLAQSLWGKHSLMVREHFFSRTFGRSLQVEGQNFEELRMGVGMSFLKYFHTKKVSLYLEGGMVYTYGWYLGDSADPQSEWIPDYSVGLAFPVSKSALFQIGAQYMPLGFDDDWKLETGFVWGY